MIELVNENKKLRKETARQAQVIADKEQRIMLLEQKIDALARKVFGKSSEKLDENQMQLLLEGMNEPGKPADDGREEPEAESSSPPKPKAKRKPRTETLPKNLKKEYRELLPEEVRKNPRAYRRVGEPEKTSKLDYHPGYFQETVTLRPKFVRAGAEIGSEESQFLIAPLPPSLKERSLLTPSLSAEIAVNRYCWHLPYYRLEQMFLVRHGVHLPRSVMSQWMGELAHDYLSGIYRAMHDEMLRAEYLQADETPIDYLCPGHGSTKQGYLWTLSHPDLNATTRNREEGTVPRGDILFQWHKGRSAECLKSLLRSDQHCFIGILQTDAYSSYTSYQNKVNGLLTLVACLAHIRRKFYDARKQSLKLSGWFLNQFKQLYEIEAELRERRAGPALREATRASQSLPIYHRIKKALLILIKKRRILPESDLGKALSYGYNNWGKMERCFTDGRLEIDNNLVENGIRPTKLGAKNWLFMGSEAAGQTNAVWFSVVESCRRRKLDPWKYLEWIFTELPKIKVKRKETFHDYTPKAYEKNMRNVTPMEKAA